VVEAIVNNEIVKHFDFVIRGDLMSGKDIEKNNLFVGEYSYPIWGAMRVLIRRPEKI
jgi:hypothetical protein